MRNFILHFQAVSPKIKIVSYYINRKNTTKIKQLKYIQIALRAKIFSK